MIQSMLPDSFIKAFVAQLVLQGYDAIAPRDPKIRLGLRRVGEILQHQVESSCLNAESTENRRGWVKTANQVRISPTGGVENWERAFRAAQLTFTQVGNPDYELITFAIDGSRAKSEIETLTDDQEKFITEVADEFLAIVG
jgi:hypothetical protein